MQKNAKNTRVFPRFVAVLFLFTMIFGTIQVSADDNIPVTGITLNKTNVLMVRGQTDTLTENISPSNATNKTVTWTSENNSVVTVSAGKVTAVGVGTTKVWVKAYNGYSASCTIQVINPSEIEVSGITLDRTEMTIATGTSAKLNANIIPTTATNKTVTWASTNPSVATVYDGEITAISGGDTVITAKTANGKKATCVVHVYISNVVATGVSLNKNTLYLMQGSSETLVAKVSPDNAGNKSVTWKSSNPSIASVSSSGRVTAVALGTASISVTTVNGKIATCAVTVTPKDIVVSSVMLNKSSITLNTGKSETLTATITPSSATDKTLTWSSSNPSVATVTDNGKITAVSQGTAIITVKSSNDKSSICTVNVIPCEKPTISKQPADVSCNEGETANFAVVAKGTGLKYLWQYKYAGDTNWTYWTSKTTASISVVYAEYRNGMKLRCIITDVDGQQVTSDQATLNYYIPVAITTQPANATVNEGQSASFSVIVKGTGLKYLWQYKEAGKTTWTDWTSKTTASINVAYAAFRDGMSLRCEVTDATGAKATSNIATLTYNVPLSITKQPASTTVNANNAASFGITATGKGLKYLWQYKNAGDTSWTDWTSKTTANISVAYAAYRDGMSLRCVVTDATGKKVTSDTATLTYNVPLSITKQPANATVDANNTASFGITAIGKGLKYLWQYKNAGSSSWTDWTSKTTASISVAYAAYRDGMSLRCVVTDANGKKMTSDTATLTYNIPLSITKQPVNVTVDANSAASFSVTATGKGLKYLWQYKKAGDTSWTDWTSKTTANISVAYADYRNGMSVRCVVTDAGGKKVTSNSATLSYK
ncbi:MAG: Ig-like domain-containing protein [Lachnospiraceae bacterium]|nr:Ig-like domain-containing protein [Lachnospiraceae bacterium]